MYRILSNFSHKNIEKTFFITIVPSLEEANKLVEQIKSKKKPFKNIQTSYTIEETNKKIDLYIL
jgi:putative IMPACT (imprinted ancient) family translation regulator